MKLLKVVSLILLLVVLSNLDLIAQCPMCKMGAESNMQNGGMAGRGLNAGILYLLALPYLLGFTMLYLFKKNRKMLEQE
ncbi:MAG: hypothetical protein ABIO44_06030 [Saprospiraceae bacterium]